MHPQLTPDRIMQTGLAFWPSKTLLSAIELGVFTELARGPEGFASLSGRLGLHPRSARDFFDALVATGFLERDGDTYRNTPATDLYLDQRKPTYIGGMLEMCNRRLYPFWSHLTEALRTGRIGWRIHAGLLVVHVDGDWYNTEFAGDFSGGIPLADQQYMDAALKGS